MSVLKCAKEKVRKDEYKRLEKTHRTDTVPVEIGQGARACARDCELCVCVCACAEAAWELFHLVRV